MKHHKDSIFAYYYSGYDLACAMVVILIAIALIDIGIYLFLTYVA